MKRNNTAYADYNNDDTAYYDEAPITKELEIYKPQTVDISLIEPEPAPNSSEQDQFFLTGFKQMATTSTDKVLPEWLQ